METKQRGSEMHPYRTHSCDALRSGDIGTQARLAGWISRRRDHGDLLFVDLRDHYGVTQLVSERGQPAFEQLAGARLESVVSASGTVTARSEENVNTGLSTGEVELAVSRLEVLSACAVLPFPIADANASVSEDLRLRHRFLDLRRAKPHENVVLRARGLDPSSEARGPGLPGDPDS